MSANINQELTIGKQAARKLQKTLRSVIKQKTSRRSGYLSKSKVTAKSNRRTKELDRLTITSTHYSFKLHYGFEGVKSNGVLMRLQSTDHFNIAFNQSKALPELANKIGEIRADQMVAKINF